MWIEQLVAQSTFVKPETVLENPPETELHQLPPPPPPPQKKEKHKQPKTNPIRNQSSPAFATSFSQKNS